MTTKFNCISLTFNNTKTYLFSVLFVLGNILLPQLCHLLPLGGPSLLPIYFFTLIAGYKFGLRVGLLTAILSPIVNSLLFGMPPVSVLPIILIKSSLLAVAAALIASKSAKLSLLTLLAVILSYQIIGTFAEWAITGSFTLAIQDFRIGFPGMLIQLFLGYVILRFLAKYEL